MTSATDLLRQLQLALTPAEAVPEIVIRCPGVGPISVTTADGTELGRSQTIEAALIAANLRQRT